MARRHARLLLPQRDRRLPAGDGDARRRCGAGGGLLARAAARRCRAARSASSIPNATTVADLQKFGKLGLYNGAYGDNIHIYGITLAKSIAGVSVGAELSYRQNMPLASDPVQVLPAAFVPLVPGSIATTAVPTSGTPGALGDTVARRAQRGQHLPDDRAVRYRGARGRAHLDAVVEGDAERGGVQGTQQLHADRQGRRRTSSVSRSTSRRRGSRSFRASTCLRRSPGARGFRATRRSLFGGSEGGGNWSAGVAADIYQKYRIDLKYSGYYGDYSTDPDQRRRPRAASLGVPNGANASLSDRGWVSLTFKTTF